MQEHTPNSANDREPVREAEQGTPSAGPSPRPERAGEDIKQPASGGTWLPLLWIAGGAYFLVRSGWPPPLSFFSVGACVAMAIGVALWFVERVDVFRPWRVVIHYVLLGIVLAALGVMIAWDVAKPAMP
jgi:hypothetical protein